jgi:hypothetical protein
MRNPLAWIFLVVGLLAGSAISGLLGSSAAVGTTLKPIATPTATATPTDETNKPDRDLPFNIRACHSPNCTDPENLPDGLNSGPLFYKLHLKDLPSNMSVNGGDVSNVQGVMVDLNLRGGSGPKTATHYLAITIVEDKDHGHGRRMQTLYIPYPSTPYAVISCPRSATPPSSDYSMPACAGK